MPKINLSKIGHASAAAAAGAILAVAPVFAQTPPTTRTPDTGSVITIIITAAHQAELAAETADTAVDENDADDADVEVADVESDQVETTHKVTVTVNGQTKTVTAEHETESSD